MEIENGTIYQISLNVVGEELVKIWIEACSRQAAVQHAKYNINPRAVIQDIEPNAEPPSEEIVHQINQDGKISTKRGKEIHQTP